MLFLFNLIVIALSLVMVLAIAGATSRPPSRDDESTPQGGGPRLPLKQSEPSGLVQSDSLPAAAMPLVRAAGWQ